MPTLRQSVTIAHVAPLAVFMALNLLPGWLRIANPELPWYRQAPEYWVYPLQCLLCGGLLLAYRNHYQLQPWRGLGIALALAALGFVLWITPSWLHDRLTADGQAIPSFLEWLGVVERKKGLDPAILAAWPDWQTAAIVMRFFRMVVIVPFVEELFWRGFLMRYVTAEDRPWTSVPFGLHRWRSFWIVTTLVMLAHSPADYLAALIWGALVYYAAVRTRSLGACIFMHAACNLCLGLYILKTHKWGFW